MGHSVARGQIVTGIKSLSSDLGLSIQQARTALKHLKSTGEITIQPTNRFSIVTICNYEKYQDREEAIERTANKPANKRATSKQQTDNKQLTTNNNNKQLNNETMEQEREGGTPSTPVSIVPVQSKTKTTVCTPHSIDFRTLAEIANNPKYGDGDKAFTLMCFEEMFNWSQSGQKRKADWAATLRNWILRRRREGALPHNRKGNHPKTFTELEQDWQKEQFEKFMEAGDEPTIIR